MAELLLPDPPLRGQFLALRAWRAADMSAVVAAWQDPAIVRFAAAVPACCSEADGRAWFASQEPARRDGLRLELAIVALSSDDILGSIALSSVERAHGRAMVSFWVEQEARGQGVARRALRPLAEWAFSSLGLTRLELFIEPDNAASQRVAESCGFVREGLLRSRWVSKGRRRDSAIYGLLAGELTEHALPGGCQTDGVVRVGATVRRPLHARSDYVHALLEHLESVGFDGAPRHLGSDEHGREVLSYFTGEVIARCPARLSDARLESAARLIRRFHDATAGTLLAGGEEVVCHGDLGPHNIVFDGDTAVGLIDWDDGVAPGPRLVDFAHAVWCCADVCEDGADVSEQARKLRLMCDAYGWEEPSAVVDEIAARLRRARDDHAACGRAKAVAIFEQMIVWMERNSAELKAGL